jgi:hypothetical protein
MSAQQPNRCRAEEQMKLIVSELGALKGYVSREFYFIMLVD